jgi:hypothetical protein
MCADIPVTCLVGAGPGGAGPVGVMVKISHRLGVEPNDVRTGGTYSGLVYTASRLHGARTAPLYKAVYNSL